MLVGWFFLMSASRLDNMSVARTGVIGGRHVVPSVFNLDGIKPYSKHIKFLKLMCGPYAYRERRRMEHFEVHQSSNLQYNSRCV